MAAATNGVQASGKVSTPRAARRLVLLQGDNGSDVAEVLREYQGADVSGARLHRDLQQQAGEHAGRTVAAEWMGPLGWTRFLWCRKWVRAGGEKLGCKGKLVTIERWFLI